MPREWTSSGVSATSSLTGLGRLAALALDQRIAVPGGVRVLLVHASPGRDDGPGMHPDRSDEELSEAGFGAAVADLILVGHTHVPGERRVAGCQVVNPGPVSLPRTTDDLARWLLLTAAETGYTIEHRAVRYDLGRVIDDLERQRHPAAAWLAAKMSGTR